MRRYELDHLRGLIILLLFPVHTFMIWNDFGPGFYVWLGGNRLLSAVIAAVNPWFMPVLFAIAGISARLALQTRSSREFLRNRTEKLLLPFGFGLIFLVPVQTHFARMFFCGDAAAGFADSFLYFFTRFTDLTGYDGGFTPGHLWFILFLYLISLAAVPVFRFLPSEKVSRYLQKLPSAGLIPLFLPVWAFYYLGNFGGFSLGKNFALFLLGYYVLSDDAALESLDRLFKPLTALFGLCAAAAFLLYHQFGYYGDLWVSFYGWVGILALLAFARRFLRRPTRFTPFISRASYPVYILHQTVLVVFAYFVVRRPAGLPVRLIVICFGSFGLTLLAYAAAGLIPGLGPLVGIRPERNKPS